MSFLNRLLLNIHEDTRRKDAVRKVIVWLIDYNLNFNSIWKSELEKQGIPDQKESHTRWQYNLGENPMIWKDLLSGHYM